MIDSQNQQGLDTRNDRLDKRIGDLRSALSASESKRTAVIDRLSIPARPDQSGAPVPAADWSEFNDHDNRTDW